jgi:hypothetical protein
LAKPLGKKSADERTANKIFKETAKNSQEAKLCCFQGKIRGNLQNTM